MEEIRALGREGKGRKKEENRCKNNNSLEVPSPIAEPQAKMKMKILSYPPLSLKTELKLTMTIGRDWTAENGVLHVDCTIQHSCSVVEILKLN
jgi:hypothetical protein